jgi:hypothetical protein
MNQIEIIRDAYFLVKICIIFIIIKRLVILIYINIYISEIL